MTDPVTAWTDERARATLLEVFKAALASADPRAAVRRALPAPPSGRCVVVGAGKASAVMAAALDEAWPDVNLSGVVVTRDGHAVPAGRVKILEAAHPVPDARSEAAAQTILQAVQGLTAEDLVVALISGGGSALLAAPAAPLTLADKQAVNRALLESGATIREMNIVRKHLSAVKGGRLAQAAQPAQLLTLIISDVPGDNPSDIASGPTVPDTSTLAEVRDIVDRYGLNLPAPVKAYLEVERESLSPAGIRSEIKVIAAPLLALEAASRAVRTAGLHPLILGDALEGESRELATVMAGIATSVKKHGHPVTTPALLLSGGETTVTLQGQEAGRGGRNTEFLLALAVKLAGEKGIWAIAGDSDGIDGTENAAGAFVTPDTLDRGKRAGRDARTDLRSHDSYGFFYAIGDLLLTGPTLTNVNDIRAVLITGAGS